MARLLPGCECAFEASRRVSNTLIPVGLDYVGLARLVDAIHGGDSIKGDRVWCKAHGRALGISLKVS